MKDLIASIYAVCLSALLWAPIFAPKAQADLLVNPFVFDAPPPGGGGTSPGTLNLVAWYDFADATDSHSTYDLTEEGSGTIAYTAGPPSYGTSARATSDAWTQDVLDDNWGAPTTSDWAVALRVRVPGGSSERNLYLYRSHNGGWYFRWSAYDGGIYKTAFKSSLASAVYYDASEDTGWHTYVMSMDGATQETKHYFDGVLFATTTSTSGSSAATPIDIGQDHTNNAINADFDWMAFFSQELTQENVDWLHNSGGTRTYADL